MREITHSRQQRASGCRRGGDRVRGALAFANGELITTSLRNHESTLDPANLANNTHGRGPDPVWDLFGAVTRSLMEVDCFSHLIPQPNDRGWRRGALPSRCRPPALCVPSPSLPIIVSITHPPPPFILSPLISSQVDPRVWGFKARCNSARLRHRLRLRHRPSAGRHTRL